MIKVRHKHRVHPHHVHRRKHHRSVAWVFVLAGLFVVLLIGISSYLPQSWFSWAKEEELTGTHEVLVSEDFSTGKSEVTHFLKTKSERLKIANPTELKKTGGDTLTVRGKKMNAKVLTLSPGRRKVSPSGQPGVGSIGDKKIAVLLVDFADASSTTLTPEQAAAHINGDFRNFYLENSFNKLGVSGDAFGRFHLPIPFTCDVWSILSQAVNHADSQVDFTQYNAIMIAFPDDRYTCGFAGVSTIGSASFSTNDGYMYMPLSWYTDYSFSLRATAHEFAHGWGAYHANGWNCGPAMAGSSCQSVPYADPVDPMGMRGGGHHFNMYYKELFGWVTRANVLHVNRSGRYKIDPLEKLSNRPQVIKIAKQDGSYYYIYQRLAFGTMISWGPTILSSGDSHLVDSTPDSAMPEFPSDFADSQFTVGKVFTDSAIGLSATIVSKKNDIVTLDISLP